MRKEYTEVRPQKKEADGNLWGRGRKFGVKKGRVASKRAGKVSDGRSSVVQSRKKLR